MARYDMGLGMAVAAVVHRLRWFDAAMVFGLNQWVLGGWCWYVFCVIIGTST
jgi:hypothetical protein